MRRYRSVSIAVFAIAFCALVGGFYGRSALAVEDQVPDQYKVFTAALNAIDANYVGTVESDRLVYGAITGMLQTLDPHSSFMDPRTYAQMRERQEGRSYGLGIPLAVVRDEIHIPTVPAAFMLDPQTGYVRLSEFGENTDQELGQALRALQRQGMKRLVFDLRNNPGGALDQAIKVANRFLPRGDMVVYTRGRVPNSDQDYRATESSDYLSVPMVTLTNRSSASASEIVSGALQDHDRSLIVGETTFGKALVQSVYRVSEGAGVAVTTAHYYTPSGRLIQRPWDDSFDEYLTYTMRDQDPNKAHNPEDLKLTDAGRKVYSGGGIEPDRRFDGPLEGFNPTRFGRTLYARNIFDVYAQRFARKGDTRISQSPAASARELSPGYDVTDAMVAEFRGVVEKSKIKMDEADWQKDLPFIKAMIRYEIDLDLFGVETARKDLVKSDPQLQFAVTLFPDAQRLLDMSKISSTRRAAN